MVPSAFPQRLLVVLLANSLPVTQNSQRPLRLSAQLRPPAYAASKEQMTEEKYSDAWKRRKFWSRLDSGLLVLITFLGVFVPLLVFAIRKHLPTPFIVFAVIWFSANLIISFVHAQFRCPRCNHRFSVAPPRARSIRYLPYCANCGLPEGSGSGPSIDPRFDPKQSNQSS